MKIATAGSRTSKRWRTQDITWDAFLARLREPLRTGETFAEYQRMDKDEQGRKKEAAGGFVGGAMQGGRRVAGAVTERWLVTLDADEAKAGDWENATCLCDWRMAVYSTHSHSPDKPRLRWVLPLKRGVGREEYQAIARAVALELGIIETLDTTTYQPERLMYWPTCAQDGEYVFHEQDGPTLDPDAVLRMYGPEGAWRDTTMWPIAAREKEVVLREAKRQADPESKGGIVGVFCRTYDVPAAIDEFLPDVYEDAGEGRYTYTGGSTSAGAVLYGDGAWLYSNHATDPAGGMLCNAFDLVRVHKFGEQDAGHENQQDSTKLPSYKAMCQWAAELGEVKHTITTERMERAAEDFADLESETTDKSDPEWTKKIVTDKNGVPEQNIANAVLFLRNLPEFKGKLGYNPMSDTITVKGELPWWKQTKTDDVYALLGMNRATQGADEVGIWGENDWSHYYAYFEHLGFQTKGQSNGVLDNALRIVSQENTYHPIRAYLAGLEWDGVERLDTMFIRWLGAEDDELNRTITRLWMLAGVDRIMRPGCQFDQMLITVGPQGIGKTKILRALAKGFFTNSVSKINICKETAELLQGVWIVELGELDGMRRSEATAVKNFVTTTVDRYRGAYTRAAQNHDRQCIFAGTTNEATFLRDDTGERRFWVMPVSGTGDRGRMTGFAREVDQLWAEAVFRWKERMMERMVAGQTLAEVDMGLWLEDERLDEQMKRRQEDYKLPDEDREAILDYIERPRPDNWEDMDAMARRDWAQGNSLIGEDACHYRIDRISIKEIRVELFGERMDAAARQSGMSYFIADVLNSAPGWKAGKQARNKAYEGRMKTWWRVSEPPMSEDTDEGCLE